MTLSYPIAVRRPGGAFRRFVLDHNPFYLMSAASMLAGCFALTSALQPRPGQIAKLVSLLGTLHIYELLLLALAVFLVRGRGMLRDGRIVLIIQTVFLADATFLAAEIYTADLRVGTGAAVVSFALAVAKVLLANRLLSPTHATARTAVVLAALGLLYALPGFLARADRATGSVDFTLYAVWWSLGLLLVAATAALPVIPRGLSRAYLLIPLASVAAHLLMSHWVYKAHVHAANFAPLFIAAAVAFARYARHLPAVQLRPALFALVFTAGLCTLGAPDNLAFAGDQFTPLRCTLATAAVAFTWFWAMGHGREFIPAAVLSALFAAMGRNPAAMAQRTGTATSTTFELLTSYLPTTAAAWGLLAVVLSFLLLAAGAAVSLLRPPADLDVTDPPNVT